VTVHSSFPVFASSATSLASSRVTKTFPFAYATPRLSSPQHTVAKASCGISGSYFHFTVPSLAFNAKTYFGPVEVLTYIVSPTTIGVASWDSSEPSERIHRTRRRLTFPVLI